MMIMREVMMRMRAIMKTIFTGAAHGESEDGGGVAVAVAVVLELACQCQCVDHRQLV